MVNRPKADHVFLRIKRFGAQWATCGIGVRPPEELIRDPRRKRLCPKLVPGQVIELPVTHPLVQKRSRLVEEVDAPERDEFIRPWVFHSAEEAAMANPSKSRLGPEQIMNGLTLREGAVSNAPRHREKARQAYQDSRTGDEPVRAIPESDYEDVRLPDSSELSTRSQNRVMPDVASALRGGEPETDKRPARRARAPVNR